jgi:erythromycin esterase-like protein
MTTTLRDYVQRNATILPENFNGRLADIRLLSSLDMDVKTANVIVLGELNHFVHEKSDFRQYFSRYLVSRGATHFAEELGWSDGQRVAQFCDGDDGALNRLPSFGYQGHRRSDRDDQPTGILRAASDAYPTSLFLAEQSRFYRQLRALCEEADLQYFGFDIDGSPGGSYEDIGRILGALDGSLLAPFLSTLARVVGESILEEADRLERAREGLQSLSSLLPPRTFAKVKISLSALIDSLRYVNETKGAKTYDALRPGMAMREEAMKRRLDDIETLRDTCSPLIVMGHALHLVKDDRKLQSGPGIGPGGGLTCSLGHHIAQDKRKQVLSVWFVYGAGEDSQPFPDLPNEVRYPASSINALFSSLGKPFFLRTTNAVFRQPVKLGHMYNALIELSLVDQLDAIFFLPRVTKLQATP